MCLGWRTTKDPFFSVRLKISIWIIGCSAWKAHAAINDQIYPGFALNQWLLGLKMIYNVKNEVTPSPAECAMHIEAVFHCAMNLGVWSSWLNIRHRLGYSQKLSCLSVLNIEVLPLWSWLIGLTPINVIALVGLACTAFAGHSTQQSFVRSGTLDCQTWNAQCWQISFCLYCQC